MILATDNMQFIQLVLQEATAIANRNFGNIVTNSTKEGDNNQVLTETDLEIGKLILKKIEDVFPEHNIIDEEAGIINKNSEYTWVVDPIDGTSNFANGIPTYGIMIGLLQGSVPIAGGIALPFFDEIYLAKKGRGTYCNSERLSISAESSLSKSLVAYGIDGHQESPQVTYDEVKLLSEIILRIRNLRTSNSVFDAAMTAKGRYGAMLNRTSKIWDNVAQQIIIEEAGGIYTDFFGKPLDYSSPLSKEGQNFTWCAGSSELHKQLQNIIHKSNT